MAKPNITTRATKGSALTWAEGDTNLTNLRDATIGITDGTNSGSLNLNDTLSFTAGTNVSLTYNSTSKALTINSTASSGVTISDDTSTNATRYLVFEDITSGSVSTVNVASTKLTFNPSTGVVTATGFSGPLTGNASSATNVGITNNNTAATEHYITFVSANSGNNALKVNSSSLRYFPQQGALFANSFQGAFNSDSFRINTGMGWSNWTTAGLGFKSDALTYNENTATGTKADAYVHSFQTPTLTSTGILTVTDAATLYLAEPVAGTNTTITNKYSLITGGNLKVDAQREIHFADSDSSNYVGFKAPVTVSANKIWTLPAADGTNGQVLSTNGSGTLSWATAGSGAQVAVLKPNHSGDMVLSNTASNASFPVSGIGYWLESDPSNIVTVANEDFTVAAGSYYIEFITAPLAALNYGSGSSSSSLLSPTAYFNLYNVTGATVIKNFDLPQLQHPGNGNSLLYKSVLGNVSMSAYVTVATNTTFRIRYSGVTGTTSSSILRLSGSDMATLKIFKLA